MESRGKVFPWGLIIRLASIAGIVVLVGWQLFKRNYILALQWTVGFVASWASGKGYLKTRSQDSWPRIFGAGLLCIVGFAVLCVVLGIVYYGFFKGR